MATDRQLPAPVSELVRTLSNDSPGGSLDHLVVTLISDTDTPRHLAASDDFALSFVELHGEIDDFDRVARATSAFARHQERGTFCTASADVLGVASAGVSLMSARHNAPVCRSDERWLALAESQSSLGERPSLDVFAKGEATHEPNREHPPNSATARLQSDRLCSSAPTRRLPPAPHPDSRRTSSKRRCPSKGSQQPSRLPSTTPRCQTAAFPAAPVANPTPLPPARPGKNRQ